MLWSAAQGWRGEPGRVPRLYSVGVVGGLSRCGEGDLGDDRREDNSKISFRPAMSGILRLLRTYVSAMLGFRRALRINRNCYIAVSRAIDGNYINSQTQSHL